MRGMPLMQTPNEESRFCYQMLTVEPPLNNEQVLEIMAHWVSSHVVPGTPIVFSEPLTLAEMRWNYGVDERALQIGEIQFSKYLPVIGILAERNSVVPLGGMTPIWHVHEIPLTF